MKKQRTVRTYMFAGFDPVEKNCIEVKTQVKAKALGFIPYWKTIDVKYVEEA